MSSSRKRARSTSPAAAAASGRRRRSLSPVQTVGLGRTSPIGERGPSPTPSPPSPSQDTLVARRARRREHSRGVTLLKIDLPADASAERKYINDQRNAAIDNFPARAEDAAFPERAASLSDPVLRITEDPTLTYAQQADALRRLALNQHVAKEASSARTKHEQKRQKDKLEKRKAAKQQCAPQSHKRRGGPRSPPPDKPTPGAAFTSAVPPKLPRRIC